MEVPFDKLQPETLERLIHEFVTRDGTDYGEDETPLDKKVASVRAQLQRREVVIAFDAESESCNILTRRAYAERLAKARG